MTQSYEFQHAFLYISGTVDYIKILIVISTGVFPQFFEKSAAL